MPLLKLEQVCKTYLSGSKRLSVLRQIDLTLERGELVAIVGRSGSGKTTLLNLISGLDQVDEGRIFLNDKELTQLKPDEWDHVRQREVGMVFQFNQLLAEFTALENVMLPGLLLQRPVPELRKKAYELLERMDMSHRADHRPAQLSGGEQQRTAIARALINDPCLLLADEPTGSLDVESGQKVFDLILELQKALKISCMVVTHNPVLAQFCDRILGLDNTQTPGFSEHTTVGV